MCEQEETTAPRVCLPPGTSLQLSFLPALASRPKRRVAWNGRDGLQATAVLGEVVNRLPVCVSIPKKGGWIANHEIRRGTNAGLGAKWRKTRAVGTCRQKTADRLDYRSRDDQEKTNSISLQFSAGQGTRRVIIKGWMNGSLHPPSSAVVARIKFWTVPNVFHTKHSILEQSWFR